MSVLDPLSDLLVLLLEPIWILSGEEQWFLLGLAVEERTARGGDRRAGVTGRVIIRQTD